MKSLQMSNIEQLIKCLTDASKRNKLTIKRRIFAEIRNEAVQDSRLISFRVLLYSLRSLEIRSSLTYFIVTFIWSAAVEIERRS